MTAGPELIHPVILCGGAGTRLWPLSRELYPKQLFPLTSDRSLLQETADRVADPARFAPALVICNVEHRFAVAEQLREAGVLLRDIVLEPAGRMTAPAAAVAALILSAEGDDQGAGKAGGTGEERADPLMLVLPSDHAISDLAAFHGALEAGAAAARAGALVTFGVPPRGPETGYGYILQGAPLDDDGRRLEGCFEIARFVEKPDLATAQSLLAAGGGCWNSGMFLFTARRFLDELRRLEPAILSGCRDAVARGSRDLDFFRLDGESFAAAPAAAIDTAVMERTAAGTVVPVEMGWNDLGSWAALWEVGAKDEAGNVTMGDVCAQDVRNSYLHAGGRLLAVIGLTDVVVVATDDAVLAAPKDRAEEVKGLVEELKSQGRTEPLSHNRVYRPWGWYQRIDAGERFQVKHITVNPGAGLSLQKHRHRAEHWVVVNGTARITRGEETFLLRENESTYIPAGAVHRLENPGETPLRLIEVQSGSYLGEDDIVRLDDIYGRD
jgi:mannose-1-phosphate guanylyltransferase/mannose-1-phosphate guanylyltransferase/mannose-6-phosphate isomerase